MMEVKFVVVTVVVNVVDFVAKYWINISKI